MIKAVFIDIDNTLLDFDLCAAASIRDALAELGMEPPPGMFETFKRINDRLWREIERGELTREQLHAGRFRRIFREVGLTLDGPAFEARFRRYLEVSSEGVEGAEEALEYLRGKYLLCAASNAPSGQQERRLRRRGLLRYFDHVFVSGDLGATKPDPRFFAACLERLPGVAPHEVLMLGDSPTADIAGGKAAGLLTCWFDAKGEPPGDAVPDYTIHALSEIRTIL